MSQEVATLEALRAASQAASFNRWANFEVVRAEAGEAELRMPWRAEDMGQYSGFLHAGMIAALLDTACGFAASTVAGVVLASHFSVDCLSPAIGEAFVVQSKVIKAGRKQVFTSAELFGETNGARKLVAVGNAILIPVSDSE